MTRPINGRVRSTTGLRRAEVNRLLGAAFFKSFGRRTTRLSHDFAWRRSRLRHLAARIRRGREMYKAYRRGVVLPDGACLYQTRISFERG